MRMLLLSLLSIIVSEHIIAQTITSYHSDYLTVAATTPFPPEYNGNLTNYFDSCLAKKRKPQKGRILLEFVIDISGAIKPTSAKVYNQTREKIRRLKLQEWIKKMPRWTPASKNGRKVNYKVTVLLDFLEGKLLQAQQVI